VIGQTCVIRSQILLARFNTYVDPQELIALSLKGLELLPEVEATFRSLCRINLAHAELMQNHPEAAQKAFEQALPYMLNAGNFLGAVADLFYQARLAFYTGQHDRAERICQDWKKKFSEMASATEGTGQPVLEIPAARGLEVVQSILLLERHQIEEADRKLVRALELLGWGSWMELHGFIELARLRHMQRNDVGVQEILQRMSRLGPQHATCAESLSSLFALSRFPEDPKARLKAETWTRKYTPDKAYSFALGIGPYHRDAEYICNLNWAKVQIALGHFQEASIFISPALQTARDCGLLYRVAELSVQQALIYAGQGNSPAALDELVRSLDISETCGYSRIFNEGPEIERLLQQAVDKNIHSSYARKLLTSLQTMHTDEIVAQASPKMRSKRSSMVEPLSERELEVLRLLASGLAPAEVAKKLYLSPYTLKAHTQNIYAKLAVHSRIEAINKARELNLL
jgi:LuxR family maltose regulon positive regulatory protein